VSEIYSANPLSPYFFLHFTIMLGVREMVDQTTLQTIGILLTGLTVSIAAIYYTLTLRYTRKNQELSLKAQEQAVETRQTQMFMQIYNQSHNDPSFIEAWQIISGAQWDSIEDWEHWGSNPANLLAGGRVGMFYEGLGVLVKENIIPIRLIALLMTGMTVRFWERYIPIIDEVRERRNYPRLLSEAEYLYYELMKYLEEHPELRT